MPPAVAIATGQVWVSKKDPTRRIKIGLTLGEHGDPRGWDWRVQDPATGATRAVFAFNIYRLYELEGPQ